MLFAWWTVILFVCCGQDLEELLNRVNRADSALAIELSGAAIIEQIQRARERRSQITSEEMKAVIEERDTAITRVQTYNTHTRSTKGSILTHTSPKHSTHSSCVPNQKPLHHRKKKIKYDSLNIDYLSSSCDWTPLRDDFDYWSIKAHTSVFIHRSCTDLRINTPAT